MTSVLTCVEELNAVVSFFITNPLRRSMSQWRHLPPQGAPKQKGSPWNKTISQTHFLLHTLFITFIDVFRTQLLSYFSFLFHQLSFFIQDTSCLLSVSLPLPPVFVFYLFHNLLYLFDILPVSITHLCLHWISYSFCFPSTLFLLTNSHPSIHTHTHTHTHTHPPAHNPAHVQVCFHW